MVGRAVIGDQRCVVGNVLDEAVGLGLDGGEHEVGGLQLIAASFGEFDLDLPAVLYQLVVGACHQCLSLVSGLSVLHLDSGVYSVQFRIKYILDDVLLQRGILSNSRNARGDRVLVVLACLCVLVLNFLGDCHLGVLRVRVNVIDPALALRLGHRHIHQERSAGHQTRIRRDFGFGDLVEALWQVLELQGAIFAGGAFLGVRTVACPGLSFGRIGNLACLFPVAAVVQWLNQLNLVRDALGWLTRGIVNRGSVALLALSADELVQGKGKWLVVVDGADGLRLCGRGLVDYFGADGAGSQCDSECSGQRAYALADSCVRHESPSFLQVNE